MRPTLGICSALIAFGLAAATPAAHAGAAGDMAAVQNFTLSDDYLNRYMAVQQDTAKDPCHLGMLGLLKPDAQNKSLDQLAAEYDAQPGVHAMLARHGLTARQAVLGTSVLMAAAMADLQKAHPGMVQSSGSIPVSPANQAFYSSHKSQIQQFTMRIGQQEMQANGGKLPACLR